MVYGSDIDFFVLMLAHYHEIDCAYLYIKTLAVYTHLNEVFNFLGGRYSFCAAPFYALTESSPASSMVKVKNSGLRSFSPKRII